MRSRARWGRDVAAVRGDEELVVVELKLSLNLELILQTVERLAVTSKVYVGVPVGNHSLRRRRRQTVKLLRMLGLGLLVVDPDVERHGVDAVLDPGEYRPRRSRRRRELLLGEFVEAGWRSKPRRDIRPERYHDGVPSAGARDRSVPPDQRSNQGLSGRHRDRRPKGQRHPVQRCLRMVR